MYDIQIVASKKNLSHANIIRLRDLSIYQTHSSFSVIISRQCAAAVQVLVSPLHCWNYC
jgi:hypothetical protein